MEMRQNGEAKQAGRKMERVQTSQCMVAKAVTRTGAEENDMEQTRGLQGLESSIGARRSNGPTRIHEWFSLSILYLSDPLTCLIK